MASTANYNSSSSENAYPQHFPLNNQVMVASIIVLFCVIVFMIGLHIFAKFIWRSPRWNSQPTLIYYQERFPSAAPGAGLSKDSIAQLPTFTYRAPVISDPGAEENVGVLECVVCLSEFQENEKGRLLPSCKHSFHIECIDMWFYNHSTCPLCRTEVLCTITTLPLMPQTVTTHEQQQEREEETPQEAHISIETTPSAPDNYPLSTTTIPFGNHHLADPVQIPTDLLFCSNSTQLGSSQSSEKASPSSPVKATRCIPHITIEIPTRQDVNLPSPGRLSMSSRRSRCTSPYDTGCSSRTPCKSPCLRESFKRMLNGQSSFKGNSIHIL